MWIPNKSYQSSYQSVTAALLALFLLTLLNSTQPIAHAQENVGESQPVAVALEESGGPDAAPETDSGAASVPSLVPFAGARKVSMGQLGGCLVTYSNDLYCWGAGTNGQNGDGSPLNRLMPVKVPFFSGNVVDVGRDLAHACAVRNDATVWCWGDDSQGQLGNGAGGSSNTPVQVTSVTNAIAVEVYNNTSCALIANGTIRCWGNNDHSKIGNALAPNPAQTAYFVAAIDDAVDVAVGYDHVCAVEGSGTAYCWGNDASGQLGNGGGGNQGVPGQVINVGNFKQISAGLYYTCGATANGGLRCWGGNDHGQLGDGTIMQRQSPTTVATLSGVVDVEAGAATACARLLDNSLRCWGLGSAWTLGNGTEEDALLPTSVATLGNNVAMVSIGVCEACSVTLDTTLFCWGGANEDGAMGNGTVAPNVLPALAMRPEVCYELKLESTGSGETPQPDDNRSDGCPVDHYVAGEVVNLAAQPASNLFRVQAWSSGVAGAPGVNLGVLRMPAADSTISVAYAACRLLSRTHSGNGGNPTPSFTNSAGCPAGRFAPGEIVQLAATPSLNQRVKGWSGTSIAPGEALPVNSITMPDSDRVVNVEYEACFALSISATGQGELPGVFPAATNGCPAGAFVMGATVQLTASPAAGWNVAGWQGTDADHSTAALNTLTMPAADRTVTVHYEKGASNLYLPLVGR